MIANISYLLNLMDGAGHTDDIDHFGNCRLSLRRRIVAKPIPYRFNSYGTCCSERMTIQETESITPQALINIRL